MVMDTFLAQLLMIYIQKITKKKLLQGKRFYVAEPSAIPA